MGVNSQLIPHVDFHAMKGIYKQKKKKKKKAD